MNKEALALQLLLIVWALQTPNPMGGFRINSADVVQVVVHGSEKIRYAKSDVHPIRINLILAVQEDHSGDKFKCSVVVTNTENKGVEIVA